MDSIDISVTNPLVTLDDLKDHVGIGALIYNENGKVLLFHHVKYNFWTIPIGKCSYWDNPVHAMIRELKEELDISVDEDYIYEIGTFTKTYNRGLGIKTEIVQFLYDVRYYEQCRNKNKVPVICNNEPNKHDRMDWYDLNGVDQNHISDMTLFAQMLKR